MKITNTAIKLRTSIIVLTVLLFGGGFYSYVTLPKESNPSIEIPQIIITTIYPGASPADVAQLVTRPIEQEIQGINGIDEIRSTSFEGVSSIVAAFTPDIAMDEANQQIRDKVGVAQADLPADAESPVINEIDISQFPIMTVNLSASYTLTRLKEAAEDLQDEIEGIPGVLEVDLVGGLEREVQVNVNQTALQGYNLSFNDIISTIQQEDANIPGGSIDVDRQNILVRVDGQFRDPSVIESLVIKAPGGVPVYVRDVADVQFGFKDRESYARLKVLRRETDEGAFVPVEETSYDQVISLNVKKRPGENIIETAEAVKALLASYSLPTGTDVLVTGDQSEQVETLVKDLENNIIAGILFVVVVLLFFLGVRNALLVGIAIPLSMLLSFVVFLIMGVTLNMVVLFSLIIALGMLVDNAVVIVENIYRYREEGHSRWESAKLATSEVGMAVVASTATTVAVFAPLLFWPGLIGEFMSFLPLTLIVTLSSSLFVALIINPVITGYFVKVEGEDEDEDVEPSPWPRRIGLAAVAFTALIVGLMNLVSLGVLVVGGALVYAIYKYAFKPIADGFVQTSLPKLVAWYRGFLAWMLDRDYTVKRAYLRNMGAFVALTVGVVLLIAGGALSAFAGQVAGMVLLIPGGILALVGVVGILAHTLESLFLGGAATVKAGLALGVVMLLAFMVHLFSGAIDVATILKLMTLPAVVVVAGGLGMAFGRGRKTLLLTDNRARLLSGSLGALFAIIALFAIAPTGVEFFPTTDPSQVRVTVEGPLGTNIEASNRLAVEAQERIDGLLQENPESEANMQNALVNVGVAGDAAFGGGQPSPERSRLTLNLVDYAERGETSMETLARIRGGLQGIPGADIEIDQDQTGPATGPPVNIELSGPDFDRLAGIAGEVRDQLRRAAESGQIPGLVDVRDNLNTGRPEEQVVIDRERAAQFGLSTQQIATTIRTAISGTAATTYRDGEDEYDVTVRLAEADRENLDRLRDLTIPYEGEQIPLVSVADFERGSGVGSITRLDLEPVVTVEGGTAPGYSAGEVLTSVQTFLADYRENLPQGYTMAYTGESEDQAESFGFLTTALLLGVALIFMILIAQFNTISAPFLIMVAVGLSLIGVLLGLILTRTPFGLMTFIGLISLAGIVVNNNIVLVDYAMQLRARGMGKQEAILEAGATRLRPVLLTALTTVIGLIPLTFGINIDFVGFLTELDANFQIGSSNTQFWGPMGTTIISGLTFATFLTLVIVPVMYSIFDSLSTRMSSLFAGRKKKGARTPDVAEDHGDGAPSWNGQPVPVEAEDAR